MERRRVVVTGLGVLTSIGIGVDDFWNGLQQGRNGVGLITRFDTTNFDTKFAFEVKNFNPDDYIDRKAAKRMDLFTQYAIATSEMAIKDSQLNLEKIDREKFGVIFGSGIGGMTTLGQQHWVYFESKSPRKLSPFFVTMMIIGYSSRANFNSFWIERSQLCHNFSMCYIFARNC